LWSFKTSPGYQEVNLDSSPSIDASGSVLVGSYDGQVYGIPFEFATQNPTDPRVSLDPGADVPDFGGPTPPNAAVLRYVASDGSLTQSLPALDPQSRLTFKIVAHENGGYVANAAICYDWLKVSVTPPVPINVRVGTDRSVLDVEPATFWQPGVSYTLHMEGNYYKKGNPFVDLLKWVG